MKIVINRCYGGFGLSQKATKRYLELKGKECFFYEGFDDEEMVDDMESDSIFLHTYTKDFGKTLPADRATNQYYFSDYDIPRNDQDLVRVVEDLGTEASGSCAKLEVIEIPDGVGYAIEEYDGIEWIAEKHRTWGE